MCGRYGRRADKQRIAEWMQAHDTGVFDDSYFSPSYNVAPQSMQREFSARVRKSEAVALADPVLPVFEGLGG